jgi:S-formylglutathione hydrolase FrmB
VVLDPSCPLGHHVFADSANNGPWGTALVEEFLPELDRTFRTLADPDSRFLTGHSSGGWSSLWLQVAYPQSFGGTWSTAPDPVDLTDFQRIDVYREANMYRTENGERRPLARLNGQTALWYDDFCRMEDVLGFGGQLHSFEAVFGPRDQHTGRPLLLWDRQTGEIDHTVAATWRAFDIAHKLRTGWPQLGPHLRGKLHVIMGEEDTFYLEGATRNLRQTLQDLGSDAHVELVPGKNHFNLLTPELRTRILDEMATRVR